MIDLHVPETEIDALLATFPEGIIALDLETTGLSPLTDRIIEIAALKLDPVTRKLEAYATLVNPGIPIPPKTIEIHHITDDMVKDSPYFADILCDFKQFIGKVPIVAHNAKFDIGFLVFAFHAIDEKLTPNAIYDSVKMSKMVYKKDIPFDIEEDEENTPENFKLGTLAKHFGINLESHHRATDDAYACLRVFARSIMLLEPDNLPVAVKIRGHLFDLSEFSKMKDFDLPSHLKPLIEKVFYQYPVIIEYKGGANPGGPRAIQPLSFLPMPNGLILYAKCLSSNLYKSYVVKKIKSISEYRKHS
jgi:DNA polymerase-3 subunit epsilon